ncbi:hypothetical protein [Phenylobacterium sp.]|uniref:hypothetical protein n=1 Tax=Phenylobacterium sp. TaxID=1871053 RepID=UPI0019C46C8A|nr:hypothetical protein [Phenylobacterium sp.]MBC7166405.1 hypothetical protein [Phenylobacterium sp.]
MSTFEFVFSLLSLLLGLSMAEVLGGVARTVEARGRAPVSWLNMLLAVLMIADIVSFWGAAWFMRDRVEFSYVVLIGSTLFASAYYVAAYLVFPRTVAPEREKDDHFYTVRGPVIGIMLAANLTQLGLFVRLLGWDYYWPEGLDILVKAGVVWLLMAACIFVRGPRLTLATMAVATSAYVAGLFG